MIRKVLAALIFLLIPSLLRIPVFALELSSWLDKEITKDMLGDIVSGLKEDNEFLKIMKDILDD